MPEQFSRIRTIAVFLVGCSLLWLLVQQFLPPFRSAIAKRYLANAEQLFKDQRFDQAIEQFQEARRIRRVTSPQQRIIARDVLLLGKRLITQPTRIAGWATSST